MTIPRRSAGPTPREPHHATVLVASAILLTSGGIGAVATLPAQADDHETPNAPPAATVAAEPGPVCGTVTVAVTGDYLELYRAALDTTTESPDWARLAPLDRTTHTRTDTPGSRFAQYRVLGTDARRDQSPVVQVEACQETPDVTPTPTPTAPGTPAPTGAATASPTAGADGKSATGGVAKTGA